uniref:Uncharacterized protein n=1 Tax=Anopheles atroparvus TaxID=41427 RepID=A0AAG5D8U8_ANOAO
MVIVRRFLAVITQTTFHQVSFCGVSLRERLELIVNRLHHSHHAQHRDGDREDGHHRHPLRDGVLPVDPLLVRQHNRHHAQHVAHRPGEVVAQLRVDRLDAATQLNREQRRQSVDERQCEEHEGNQPHDAVRRAEVAPVGRVAEVDLQRDANDAARATDDLHQPVHGALVRVGQFLGPAVATVE